MGLADGMAWEREFENDSTYLHKGENTMTDLTDYIESFYQAYVKESYLDPHQKFADLTGLSHEEAKSLCYKILYSFDSSDIFRIYQGKLEITVNKIFKYQEKSL